MGKVAVGQIWRDKDKRGGPRFVCVVNRDVESVGFAQLCPMAKLDESWVSIGKRMSRVRLVAIPRRFTLIEDVP